MANILCDVAASLMSRWHLAPLCTNWPGYHWLTLATTRRQDPGWSPQRGRHLGNAKRGAPIAPGWTAKTPCGVVFSPSCLSRIGMVDTS
jgi:hypothetical protein